MFSVCLILSLIQNRQSQQNNQILNNAETEFRRTADHSGDAAEVIISADDAVALLEQSVVDSPKKRIVFRATLRSKVIDANFPDEHAAVAVFRHELRLEVSVVRNIEADPRGVVESVRIEVKVLFPEIQAPAAVFDVETEVDVIQEAARLFSDVGAKIVLGGVL